ncbi:MAG TPA: formyltransferase family protein [Steroidobacteraceae bacterium]|nr:formyltransferase family protein [Steroidobacteraceae bacterium]
MRFAITVTDRYLPVFQAFVEHGWTPVKVFTSEVDHRLHHHAAVLEYAQRLNVAVQISRLSPADLAELSRLGCDALIVASYRWRIDEWRAHLGYAVNFHPSPLPHGRGPYPAPAAILERATRWGVSCHKLEPQFDRGEVLRTLEFPLSADEDHDSLDLKIQLASARLAGEVAGRFRELWDGATPQGDGSYYPMWSEADRTLQFTDSVESILRRLRAFGPIECIAQLRGLRVFVRRAVGWSEAHRLVPGTVVYANHLAMVIAAADGYIGLTEWSLLAPDAVTGTPRRRMA